MRKTVSVVIPSYDRRSELEETLAQLRELSPPADEIIVFLDGCTDHSIEMLAERFSDVVVLASEKPQGSIPARDTAFLEAKGELIVSLDDDSFPLQTDFVTRLSELAERHPEAGAFAFREIRPQGQIRKLPHSERLEKAWISTYPNCAGAMRKEIYGKAARYPRFFSHAYAEPDFCLQTYHAGYGVLYAPEIEIFHRFTHTMRDMKARHHRNARNEFWSVVMRCPFPHVVWVGAYRIARQIAFGASKGWGWLKDEPKWIAQAFGRIREPLAERRPVPWRVYWQWVRMARQPLPGTLEMLVNAFPTVRARFDILTHSG